MAAATFILKKRREIQVADNGTVFAMRAAMTQPRSIIAGSTYLITRRVVQRRRLLRPEPAVNELIIYSLGVAARRYGIQLHALCVMSTHIHMVVTDPSCTLPRFLRDFHQWVAFGIKCLRRWDGAVWDNQRTNVVRLVTNAAIVEKIAYTLANPVAAGIVRHADEWPGVNTRVRQIGRRKLCANRPRVYFDERNPRWAARVEIPIEIPPTFVQDGAQKFRRTVAKQLAKEEKRAHRDIRQEDILGAERAAALCPYERVVTYEPRRSRKPVIAVGRNHKDELRQALASVRAFQRSYRHALTMWRAGVRDVPFPVGTWWMRAFHGARVVSSFDPKSREINGAEYACEHPNATISATSV